MGADVNRGDRPLSPHISIYRPQLTSAFSILHRITGVGMSVTALLIVWWFIAAASGANYFEFVDGLLTSWFGLLIMVASLWAFWFHFFNGIRHLRWDAGLGMGIEDAERSAKIAAALSVLMTILCVILAT
ncbi:MAG: succinate dehydrogenase / fumarate reductase cytochrome b subunit [Paracoccaceae bacterium]|jgi:succinate dehydrogenase / fumarate reductase cytochrome b subunit